MNSQALPLKWRVSVQRFLVRFDRLYGLHCAVLYGSLATGDYRADSDADLVLISSGVPEDFLQRLRMTSDLYERGALVEALVYTPKEFHQMIEDMHVTALDATTQGIPLVNPAGFEEFRSHTAALQSKGLRREKHAWVMDAPRE